MTPHDLPTLQAQIESQARIELANEARAHLNPVLGRLISRIQYKKGSTEINAEPYDLETAITEAWIKLYLPSRVNAKITSLLAVVEEVGALKGIE